MDAERPRDPAFAADDEVRLDAEGDAEPRQELPLPAELHVRGEVGDPLALLEDDAVDVQREYVPRTAGAGDPDGEGRAVGAVVMDALQLEGAAFLVWRGGHGTHATARGPPDKIRGTTSQCGALAFVRMTTARRMFTCVSENSGLTRITIVP